MDKTIELERTYSHKEFAIGSTNKRANFGTKKDEEKLHGKKDNYISLFDHSSSFHKYTESNGNSTAGYKGKVRFNCLAIDIDSDDLNQSLDWARQLIIKLKDEYEVNVKYLRYFFSGSKGFHIEIPSWMIDNDHEPSSKYPQIHMAMVQELTDHADLNLYQTIRLYRIVNTINSKSGLYKVWLSLDEITNLNIDGIKKLAPDIRFTPTLVSDNKKIRNEKLFKLYSKYLAKYPDHSIEKTESNNLEKIEIKAFGKILKGCDYVNNIVENARNGENIKNADRIVLGNLLARFGEEGRTKLHEILSKVPDYQREKTDYHLDQIIKQEYNPVSCKINCDKVCNSIEALNRKSCLSLAFVSKNKKYIETYLIESFIKYRTDIKYALQEDIFYQYREGVYHQLSEVELATILTSFSILFNQKENIVATRMKATVERLKMEKQIQFNGKMNEDKFIINMKNGLFDLDSGELGPHTPSVFTSIQLDFNYDSNAKAPRFEKFLCEIFDEDQDKTDYILNTMCYLLLPDYSYQKVFIFYGSGRNGKSVLTSVITNLVGKENVSNLSIHDLAQNRFALVNLKDKLINISSEIGSKDLETEMIKKISGGDGITADRKYKNPLSFVNTARLIVNANELPRFSELNEAILERFVLIRFPRTFREDVNTNLLNELLVELPGIFNLLIPRVERIRCGNGGGGVDYSIPETIQKDRIILLSEISSAAEFINEKCLLQPSAKIKLMDLHDAYYSFCANRLYKSLGYRNFKKAIESAYGISLKKKDDGLYVEGITTKTQNIAA